MNSLIRKNRTPRSFVSKYMHFHCPSIPIYDSIANSSLTQQFRWNDRYEVIEKPKIADEEFYWYVLRFWQFYRELKAKRPKATVKLADYYLLYSWQ